MEVLLVSRDVEIQKICRQVLGEILESGEWTFSIGDPAEKQSQADLYIWEFDPDLNVLDRLNPAEWQKHLILLQRQHLDLLRDREYPEFNLILKPVTRGALQTFLKQACERWKARYGDPAERINSLTSDCDELLQCLIQANLKLQEYDQDRTNFLARAIHDFRAPLTALNGYCGLLLGEQLGLLTENQKEVIQRMQYSTRRLSRMASAMFQLSVWQRVKQGPVMEKNSIQDCIGQCVQELMPCIEEKRITVTLDTPPPPQDLVFERSQLEQVLINLLDNACKFTPRFGTISIRGYNYFWERRKSVRHNGGGDRRVRDLNSPNAYRVDISDSGPGIPRSHLGHIFEEYTSYAGGLDRSGGGLGLAICRMILSWHQGRIWAESSPQGAIFSFVLPFSTPEQMSTEPRGLERSFYARVG